MFQGAEGRDSIVIGSVIVKYQLPEVEATAYIFHGRVLATGASGMQLAEWFLDPRLGR